MLELWLSKIFPAAVSATTKLPDNLSEAKLNDLPEES